MLSPDEVKVAAGLLYKSKAFQFIFESPEISSEMQSSGHDLALANWQAYTHGRAVDLPDGVFLGLLLSQRLLKALFNSPQVGSLLDECGTMNFHNRGNASVWCRRKYQKI